MSLEWPHWCCRWPARALAHSPSRAAPRGESRSRRSLPRSRPPAWAELCRRPRAAAAGAGHRIRYARSAPARGHAHADMHSHTAQRHTGSPAGEPAPAGAAAGDTRSRARNIPAPSAVRGGLCGISQPYGRCPDGRRHASRGSRLMEERLAHHLGKACRVYASNISPVAGRPTWAGGSGRCRDGFLLGQCYRSFDGGGIWNRDDPSCVAGLRRKKLRARRCHPRPPAVHPPAGIHRRVGALVEHRGGARYLRPARFHR